jgi:gliding motility-associated protein GldL
MNGINKNISSINSMFEIQAKTASEQGEAMSLVTTALKTVAGSINSSASSAEAYKSEIEKLAQQMKSLNTVYGNMLNAMTIRG